MDVSSICHKTLATPSIRRLGCSKLLSRPSGYLSVSGSSSSHSVRPFRELTPIHASSTSRTIRRRRTRRRLRKGDDSGDDDDYFGYFADLTSDDSFWYYVNPGGSGPPGGGFGFNDGHGRGGGGWNSDWSSDQNPEEPSPPAPRSFGFNFFLEVFYWIVLSNCLFFAIRKIVMIIAAAILTLKVPIGVPPF